MDRSEPLTCRVALEFSRQIDLHASLAPLGRWGDDLLDRWDGTNLVRSVRLGPDGTQVAWCAEVNGSAPRSIELSYPSDAGVEGVALLGAVGATFVLDAGLDELIAVDQQIADLAGRYPGVVPVLVPDPFAALVRSISAQQVNLRWATVIRARLAERYGRRLSVGPWHVHALDAHALASARVEDLRELQLTNAKARAVVATARAEQAGELRRDELERLDDEALVAHLTRLPGVARVQSSFALRTVRKSAELPVRT